MHTKVGVMPFFLFFSFSCSFFSFNISFLCLIFFPFFFLFSFSFLLFFLLFLFFCYLFIHHLRKAWVDTKVGVMPLSLFIFFPLLLPPFPFSSPFAPCPCPSPCLWYFPSLSPCPSSSFSYFLFFFRQDWGFFNVDVGFLFTKKPYIFFAQI